MRDFNDWEIEVVTSFFNLLYSNIAHHEGRDQLGWRLKGNGNLMFTPFYDALRGPYAKIFNLKSIWRVKAQQGSFFVWTVA